jgi:hypothetical protein
MDEPTPDVDSEAAAAAFGTLSDGGRIDILLALWQSDPLTFADLQRASGIDDSGRFNYHLDKLVGRFVQKTDEGYRLTPVGAKAVDLLLDARFGPSSPPPIDQVTVADCPSCGAFLLAHYDDGDMRLSCDACGALVHYGFFPPHGRATRDADSTLDAYSQQVWRDVTLAHRGVCPHCRGRMRTALEDDPDWAVDVAATSRCRDCGSPLSTTLGLRLLADPAVVSFLADHGHAVDERRFWEFAFVFDDLVATVSESPPRYRLTITEDDERLEVIVDDTAHVVETARRRSR